MNTIKQIAITAACSALVAFTVFVAFPKQVIIQAPEPQLNAGAAGVVMWPGSSTGDDVRVASASSTDLVPRKADRQYLMICKDNDAASTEIYFAINASATYSEGGVLNSARPCWESTDLNLVSGEINAIASIAAAGDYASVSYLQW